jgi:hypothetical protein
MGTYGYYITAIYTAQTIRIAKPIFPESSGTEIPVAAVKTRDAGR